MTIQRSVQRQNAITKAAIERAAALPLSSLPWLCIVLKSHQIDPMSGLLVDLHETPEQEGNLMSGVWLTDKGDFFDFKAMISRSEGALLAIDEFKNVTSVLPITAHASGTGASFGYLARQVLYEVRGV